ncbi:MAG: ATP-binding protein [Chloroflexi bacterium]|nr:ATP-binding protein [Chloroflexota bacterium]
MNLQFPPILPFYFVSAAMALVIAYQCWKMRPAKGAFLWTLGMVSAAIWAIGEALDIMGTTTIWKLNAIRFQYIGIIGAPTIWLLFAIHYSYWDRWLNRRTVIILSVVPIFCYLMALTIGITNWFYEDYQIVIDNDLRLLDKTYGNVFWLWVAFGYSAVVFGSGLLVLSILRYPEKYRGQATMLVIGAALPLIANIMFLTDYNPIAPFDPSSISYAIMGVIVFLAISRYGFLEIVPVAYDLVFRNVTSGVIILDNGFRVLDINPAAEKIANRTRPEVIGKTTGEAFPEYRGVMAQFRDVRETRTEIALQDKIFDMHLMPLTDRRGNVSGRIVMLYDITERKQVIQDLDAYAHTVAHDLKNPLSGLRGYIDLARATEGKQQETFLEKIDDSTGRMVSIIESLLTLASVRRQAEIPIGPIDVKMIADNAIRRLSSRIEESKAQIDLPKSMPFAVGYAPWIEEIWANYIENAIKYGGEPPVIKLGVDTPTNGNVKFWVKDNGKGLSPEEQQRLFSEFARINPNKEGHGLGLSIVKRIADRLQGTVGVESTVGEGSTFYFTLPAPKT